MEVDADGWIDVEPKTRKSRRQQAQPVRDVKPSKPAGNPKRKLPKELIQKLNAPPWRSSKGGGKGQAKETSRPHPPNHREPPAPQRGGDGPGRRRQIDLNDESILPCCNPFCEGLNGGLSFKPVHRIGKGPGGDHCQGCGMPWTASWGCISRASPSPSLLQTSIAGGGFQEER